jgi:hypothetical protein
MAKQFNVLIDNMALAICKFGLPPIDDEIVCKEVCEWCQMMAMEAWKMAEKTMESEELVEVNSNYYHYVRYDDIEAFEQLGWIVAAKLEGHHGRYSVLMKLTLGKEPITPKNRLSDRP